MVIGGPGPRTSIYFFLSQPFFVGEQFAGMPGNYVRFEDTIKGSKEVVRLLLDRGADPNMKDYSGRSPLYIAVGERESGGGEEDIEKLLRERGAKAD